MGGTTHTGANQNRDRITVSLSFEEQQTITQVRICFIRIDKNEIDEGSNPT